MAHAPLARDVVIAERSWNPCETRRLCPWRVGKSVRLFEPKVWGSKGRFTCANWRHRPRIVPHYRIDFFDEADLPGLGNRTMCVTVGAFDGRTHKKIAVLEETSNQREESILLDQNWSTRSTTFKEIENLLGQIRDVKKKVDNFFGSLFARKHDLRGEQCSASLLKSGKIPRRVIAPLHL